MSETLRYTGQHTKENRYKRQGRNPKEEAGFRGRLPTSRLVFFHLQASLSWSKQQAKPSLLAGIAGLN